VFRPDVSLLICTEYRGFCFALARPCSGCPGDASYGASIAVNKYIAFQDIYCLAWVNLHNEDGTAVGDTEDYIAPTNNFLHSLFSDCTLLIGNVATSDSNTEYPLKAFLANYLSNNSTTKASQLASCGYSPDNYTQMDTILNSG
jgi:hypothetical protein